MTAAIALPIQKSIINPLLKGYGFPVACILGSLVLLLLSIRPAYTKIQDLRVRRAQTERVLALLSNKVAKLEEFASREEALTQDFERFNRAVTSESNIPELLTQIQTIATETGVKITVLQFGGELRPSPGVGSGVVSGFEARIKFASQGSFENLRRLLRFLESATRIINVESLRYEAFIDEKTKTLRLQNELNLVSYYTPEAVPSPQTPINFDFSDPTFEKISQVLDTFTPYEAELP